MKHLYLFNESVGVDKVNYIYRHLNVLRSFISSVFPKDICNILDKCYSGACVYKNNIQNILSDDEVNIIYNFLSNKYEYLDLFTLQDYLLDLSDKIGKDNVDIEIDTHGYNVTIIFPMEFDIDMIYDIVSNVKQLEKRTGRKLKLSLIESSLLITIDI